MKNKRFPFLIMALLFLSIIVYSFWQCTGSTKDYRVITINGSSSSNNVTRSHFSFGSIPDSAVFTALTVSGGDLLYLLCESENALLFRYEETDGNHLEIETDTAEFFRVDMNGKLHTLAFFDEYDVADWIENKDLNALPDLRAIQISGSAIGDNFEVLEEIAGINPSPGLFFEDIDDPELFKRTLSLFHPTWLFLPDIDENLLTEDLRDNLEDVELLVFSTENMIDLKMLYDMPSLQSIILENWYPDEHGHIQFERITKLSSLCLVNSELISLSDLGELPELKELALIDCDTLNDISALSGLSQLNQLSLMACDDLTEISVLSEIPKLHSLSFPPYASQQQFTDILEHQNSLKAVELIECEEITKLSPLTGLEELISLSIFQEEIDFNSLEQLKTVKLITLDLYHFEDSVPGLYKLKAALPGTHIVPGGGFCMGSGWILILLPVVLGAAAIWRLRKR